MVARMDALAPVAVISWRSPSTCSFTAASHVLGVSAAAAEPADPRPRGGDRRHPVRAVEPTRRLDGRGAHFLRNARAILRQSVDAADRARTIGTGRGGLLNIGMTSSVLTGAARKPDPRLRAAVPGGGRAHPRDGAGRSDRGAQGAPDGSERPALSARRPGPRRRTWRGGTCCVWPFRPGMTSPLAAAFPIDVFRKPSG